MKLQFKQAIHKDNLVFRTTAVYPVSFLELFALVLGGFFLLEAQLSFVL